MIRWTVVSPCAVLLFVLTLSRAQQVPTAGPGALVAYPASDAGLEQQLQDLVEAANSKDLAKEDSLVRALIMPEDSMWFKDQFGPAFGPRLAAAYQRTKPTMGQEIRSAYEGNAKRGWHKPKIFRSEDAAAVDSPIDSYLNCMDKVVPLYQTAFDGNRTAYHMGRRPDDPSKYQVIAGDLPGYYVYDGGTFRFIPEEILQLLPKQRPIRVQLDMNIMRSKITNDIGVRLSHETMMAVSNTHRAGKVVIHFVLDANGKVEEIEAKEGPTALAEPFLQQAKQWIFEPTVLDGDRVEVEFDWETGFQVNGKY
jgi:Gram-negative bacterial TonB protein C-terminal